MANNFDHTAEINQLTVYQIRIKGSLSSQWTEWFDGLTITLADNGDTLLTGLVDQAALYGLLKKVRDLGMPLISVVCMESAPGNAPDDPLKPGGIL